MDPITMYTTEWCSDCHRAKSFMTERGVAFHEVNIEDDPEAATLVMKMNNGKRKVPTLEIGGRYFAFSPFNPQQLADVLNVPLNS